MKKNPTMTDVAKRAGVAKSTVSLALRNDPRVTPSLRAKIEQTAKQMGYRSNPLTARLMAELRNSRNNSYVATLGMINVSAYEDLAQRIAVITEQLDGAEARAQQLGYKLDYFWLDQPKVTPRRLASILAARNIQGVAFYGIRDDEALLRCEPIWTTLPTVVIGSHPEFPPLNFIANDHYATAVQAYQHLAQAGYRRIGIVLDKWLDTLLEHRYIAGYRTCVGETPDAPPILYLEDPQEKPRPEGKKRFFDWMRTHKPDACICINSFILDWTDELGLKVPDEFGIALLDLSTEFKEKGVAGMYNSASWLGMKSVDSLISQLHRNEYGVPPFQSGILVEGQWNPGYTVRPPSPTATAPRR